jgi:hypothetical protein
MSIEVSARVNIYWPNCAYVTLSLVRINEELLQRKVGAPV